MAKNFYWLQVPANSQETELISDLLFEAGAQGVQEVEAKAGVVLKGFFSTDSGFPQLREKFPNPEAIIFGSDEEQDWDAYWKEQQTPIQVTGELTVIPPWIQPPENAQYLLKLEAKMAFGTGSHESTKIAARLLEAIAEAPCYMLDIGAGTGILQLYAASRWDCTCVGVDIDPRCGECFAENLVLNQPALIGKCYFVTGGLELIKAPPSPGLIVANMIRTEFWPLRKRVAEILPPNGKLILSGQLQTDKQYFEEFFHHHNMHILKETTMEEWWGVLVEKH